MTLMLEGKVDNRDEIILGLQDEIARLEQELAVAKAEALRAKGENARAISALRRQLQPLYQALQQVFGAIEAIPDEPQSTATVSASANPRWESWKQKFPGKPAELIDLLLLHGELNRNQIMAALKCGKDSARTYLSKLNVAGLINKNGGKYSLKQL